jgi:hypothetical protein
MAFAAARTVRLVVDIGVELTGCIPKRTQGAFAATEVPHAGGNNALGSGDPHHLPKAGQWICHEVNDQLCQRYIENVVPERKVLRRSPLHGHPGIPLPDGSDKGLRRIDGGHGVGT